MTSKLFKTYRVTFAINVRFANGEQYRAGETRDIIASSMQMAGTQSSTNGGSDISGVELLAVGTKPTRDVRCMTLAGVMQYNPRDGKQARKVAATLGVSTRHMRAFPARVLASMVACGNGARVVRTSNNAVTLHMGGAR